MLKGIDFAFGGGVTTAQIKAAGYQFVARYLSGGNSKDISAAEVANYKAAGIPVVFVWEVGGNEFTFAQGAQDAHAADAEANNVGAPGAVIFFAQDVPVAAGANPTAYMQGVNSVIGLGRSGLYAEFDVMKRVFDAGAITYGWQTSGGSGGQWDNRALLRQVAYGVTVGPATCDVDEAAFWSSTQVLGLGDDFGQWPPPGGTPPPMANTRIQVEYYQPGFGWVYINGSDVNCPIESPNVRVRASNGSWSNWTENTPGN